MEGNPMNKLKVVSDKKDSADVVRGAILAEIKRLEISLRITERNIKALEERNNISSEAFLNTITAEDLQGGDREYIQWAGELQVRLRLLERLKDLQDVEYVVN